MNLKRIICILIVTSSHSYAYNSNRCMSGAGKSFLFGGVISTTQYISSTGDCSALGAYEQARQEFYVINFDKIMNDFAKGGGEHSTTLFLLSQCPHGKFKKLLNELRNNFQKNLKLSTEDSYLSVIPIIDKDCGLDT